MEQISLKTHYSVYELADFSLKALPKAPKNIAVQAKRENWQSRKREGRGGGLEYALASMPEPIQSEIRDRFAVSVVNKKPSLPVVRDVDLSSLTNKQRQIADARMALVAAVSQLEQSMSRIK
ncbi:MAG: DNA-binding protein, partial [[Actinobacillus] rossii]|nr:DNA-binding protein [[Actinobacillus] rossii]